MSFTPDAPWAEKSRLYLIACCSIDRQPLARLALDTHYDPDANTLLFKYTADAGIWKSWLPKCALALRSARSDHGRASLRPVSNVADLDLLLHRFIGDIVFMAGGDELLEEEADEEGFELDRLIRKLQQEGRHIRASSADVYKDHVRDG
ncbi:hypothetical protein C8F01DRAFT_1371674 [Mycena amicta]|nr:hypothetical protein C8F01DRAFT_1371674 [Mycena amicta]